LFGEDQKPCSQYTYAQLTLKFASRVLELNNDGITSYSKLDGISSVKIIICMLENLDCSAYLQDIVTLLLDQLEVHLESKTPREFSKMILQALCMAFFNSADETIKAVGHRKQIMWKAIF
jgi:hypothetical protein